MDFWSQARNLSFINKFLGKDSNSMIQHVTELKKTEKGARAVITLLADLEGDGVVGDRTLVGNEETMKSFDQVIRIDQMRNANRSEGRIADQKSIVNFRENSRDKLAYWLSDRMDQIAFLTLSGVPYTMRNNGAVRASPELAALEFAADVKAPTNRRFGRWNGTAKQIEWGTGTSAVAGADTPMWELMVQAKAYAKEQYIRGVRESGGEETFHVFLTPQAMAKLKLDPTYMQNLRHAQTRGDDNKLFSGSTVKIDGLYLHEFRHVYNTSGAASGTGKWGAGLNVDGCQMLFCGAQAMGMADLGNPEWDEEDYDYKNQVGISVAKILGFLKPQFNTQYGGNTVQDHGVFSIYAAQ
jgi:N4-gp56 family major capsid protein